MTKAVTHTFSISERYAVVLDILEEWKEQGYNLSAKLCDLIESDYNKDKPVKMPDGTVLKAKLCEKCGNGYSYE